MSKGEGLPKAPDMPDFSLKSGAAQEWIKVIINAITADIKGVPPTLKQKTDRFIQIFLEHILLNESVYDKTDLQPAEAAADDSPKLVNPHHIGSKGWILSQVFLKSHLGKEMDEMDMLQRIISDESSLSLIRHLYFNKDSLRNLSPTEINALAENYLTDVGVDFANNYRESQSFANDPEVDPDTVKKMLNEQRVISKPQDEEQEAALLTRVIGSIKKHKITYSNGSENHHDYKSRQNQLDILSLPSIFRQLTLNTDYAGPSFATSYAVEVLKAIPDQNKRREEFTNLFGQRNMFLINGELEITQAAEIFVETGMSNTDLMLFSETVPPAIAEKFSTAVKDASAANVSAAGKAEAPSTVSRASGQGERATKFSASSTIGSTSL